MLLSKRFLTGVGMVAAGKLSIQKLWTGYQANSDSSLTGHSVRRSKGISIQTEGGIYWLFLPFAYE